MKYLSSVVCLCFVVVIALVIASACLVCEHEDTWMVYSFAPYEGTEYSYVKEVCKECRANVYRPSLFKGTPTDQSYLELIRADSEILPGEYYTISAKVSVKFYNPSTSQRVSIRCKVESEDIIVGFSVEFREEFREQVKLIEEDDIITFRGRFYDTGCGFMDCELLNN